MKYFTPWVSLESIHFSDSVRDDGSHAGRFRSLPSPFWMPIGVRLLASEDWRDVALQFEYASSERTIFANYSENLQIFYGMKSKRINELRWFGVDVADTAALHKLVAVATEKFSKVHSRGEQSSERSVDDHCKAIKKSIQYSAQILIEYFRNIKNQKES